MLQQNTRIERSSGKLEESHEMSTHQVLEFAPRAVSHVLSNFGEKTLAKAAIPQNGSGKIEAVAFDQGVIHIPERKSFIFSSDSVNSYDKITSWLQASQEKLTQVKEDHGLEIAIKPNVRSAGDFDPRSPAYNTEAIEEDLREEGYRIRKAGKDPEGDPYGKDIPEGKLRSIIAMNLGRGNTGGLDRFEDAEGNLYEFDRKEVNSKVSDEASKEPGKSSPELIPAKLKIVRAETGEDVKLSDLDEKTLRFLYRRVLYGEREFLSKDAVPNSFGPEDGSTVGGVEAIAGDLHGSNVESIAELNEVKDITELMKAETIKETLEMEMSDEQKGGLINQINAAKGTIVGAVNNAKGLHKIREGNYWPEDFFFDGGEVSTAPVIISPDLMIFKNVGTLRRGNAVDSVIAAKRLKSGKWEAKVFEQRNLNKPGVGLLIDEWLA